MIGAAPIASVPIAAAPAPVGATTYTLSAATYTNLTSTGVTPRVTVTVA
jgi:hypothetical protein